MLEHTKYDVDGGGEKVLEATILTKIISGQGTKTNVCVGGDVGAKHVVSPPFQVWVHWSKRIVLH